MGLDLKSIAPDARIAFIKIGGRFGSEDTLDQANQTLNAYEEHGPKLGEFGFTEVEALELTHARDALIAAGVGREAKRTDKMIDTVAYAAAMRDGMDARLRARSVLNGSRRVLLMTGQTDAVQKVDVVLASDAAAEDDAEGLAKQLDALRGVLTVPAVADAAKNRGGPEVVQRLEALSAALRDAAKAKATPRGTPVETEKMDLIDGIIVSLVRMAREAADAAARELGKPAISTAFELSALYKRRPKKKPEDAP